MPPSAHEAEFLNPLVEHLALLRGQHFGHISQCADQILADHLGLRKALRAQLFERGPVDRVRQEQIMYFLPGGAQTVMQEGRRLRPAGGGEIKSTPIIESRHDPVRGCLAFAARTVA